MNQITVGVITISDRASEGLYDDLGGPALKEVAQKNGWQVLSEAVIGRMKKFFIREHWQREATAAESR